MLIYEITTNSTEQQLLQRLSQQFGIANATSLEDLNKKVEQKLIDKCAVRVGLPPGSTVDQVLAAQKNYVKTVLPGIQADRAKELTKIDSVKSLSAQEILKRELPAIEQLKAQAGKAIPAATRAGWLQTLAGSMGVVGRMAAAATGIGATLASYSSDLNSGEEEELARRRQLPPKITK
jgi:hypothetical protein